jgi:hypothetical protein
MLVLPISSQMIMLPNFYIVYFTYCLYFYTPKWCGCFLLTEKYLCTLFFTVISNICKSFWRSFSSPLENIG